MWCGYKGTGSLLLGLFGLLTSVLPGFAQVPERGLLSSTVFGGASNEVGNAVALDPEGNIWIVGGTTSTRTFPLVNPLQGENAGGTDILLVKLDRTGSKVLLATFLGGSGDDEAKDIAIDNLGNVFLCGRTNSPNFPVTKGAFQTKYNGGTTDVFLVKLPKDGSQITYATYIGGNARDDGAGVAVDRSGNVYLTGLTNSQNFPLEKPFQPKPGGGGFADAFIMKLDAQELKPVYSTYLGGDEDEVPTGIAVDAEGNAAIAGFGNSSNFPTVNALQKEFKGGFYDGFAAKLDAAGTALVFSTYLGGTNQDRCARIAADGEGNTYVVGYTFSPDFTTVKPFQPAIGGNSDAFVVKFAPTGTVVFSTFLGGNRDELGYGIAVDGGRSVWVTGGSFSTNFPLVNSFRTTVQQNEVYVARLSPAGDKLLYSTFAGGADVEAGFSLTTDGRNTVLVAGQTFSKDFPLKNPVQLGLSGFSDAFLLRITDPPQFLLVFDPATVSVARGKKVNLQLKLVRGEGFTDPVTVAVQEAPKLKLKPSTLTLTGLTASFSCKVPKDAPTGMQTLSFTARDKDGRQQTAAITVEIK
ncbi:MAG: SBBP repeat-containing protein [Blastocatellia bacterium]|nr:SBBP repeat-containing protein [Blastocatellia bacterium]